MNMVYNKNGFTIIELALIVMFIGILSFVTMSSFSSSSSSIDELKLAQKIVDDIQYCRKMAMEHGQTTKCFVDIAQNRYSLTWANDSCLKTFDNVTNDTKDIDRNISDELIITSTELKNGLLLFNSAGIPFNLGDKFESKHTLLVLNNKIAITLDPQSGECDIEIR